MGAIMAKAETRNPLKCSCGSALQWDHHGIFLAIHSARAYRFRWAGSVCHTCGEVHEYCPQARDHRQFLYAVREMFWEDLPGLIYRPVTLVRDGHPKFWEAMDAHIAADELLWRTGSLVR